MRRGRWAQAREAFRRYAPNFALRYENAASGPRGPNRSLANPQANAPRRNPEPVGRRLDGVKGRGHARSARAAPQDQTQYSRLQCSGDFLGAGWGNLNMFQYFTNGLGQARILAKFFVVFSRLQMVK